MDMSVKLNLSYPAARPAEPVGERAVARLAETPKGTDALVAKADLGVGQDVNDIEKVKSAVSDIEKFLSSTRRNLEFSTDEESGKIVVRVIASETGEVVRQLPSEEALRIARSLSDVNSILFDAKV
ncbi:flagellar protein FlaG [Pseudomonas sp. SWRI107]|uniref:flagellar protein FlaG n=1 Tax=Pseudomonas farsensis TaxID=2745492 RepID=UPI001644F6F4|nr:flagellar protein FlaG [Pseudomonas farsensis]MBV4533617.1 flagellar protein FlaG [Pseudomonas farsensis]